MEINEQQQPPIFPDIIAPEVPEVETQEPAVEEQKQTIVIGNKVFNSAEEALAYANGLAESQQKAAASLNRTEEPAPQPAQKIKLGQLLFEDPEEALAQVQAQAVAQMESKQAAVEQNRKFWEDFYLRHSDLRGSELLVDAVLGKESALGSFNGLNRSEGAPILAAKVRAEISKIRNVPSGGQALPSKPAMVAGASGASTPKPIAQKPEPTNFISELRSMRKRS